MDNFETACNIAAAASYLDEIKNTRSPAERNIATKHVNALHDAAKQLAGDRVGELYAEDDGSNVVHLAQYARTCGCDES